MVARGARRSKEQEEQGCARMHKEHPRGAMNSQEEPTGTSRMGTSG